jgi:adenylyltransferase/sulfurtransferase
MHQEDIFKRYSRQIFIEEIGLEGQKKDDGFKSSCYRSWRSGKPCDSIPGCCRVGTIGIADFDRVEIHNLNRQIIHTENEVGVLKIRSAEKFVSNLNHHVKVMGIEQKIDGSNIPEILSQYDFIVDGSDNFSTRYLVNDTCVTLNKTLIYGSILGFSGQIAVFNHQGSKNLRDIFPEPPYDEEMPDCDSLGVLGALPGIVGSMMALQTLKLITGLPVNLNQLTLIDTMNWRFQSLDF